MYPFCLSILYPFYIIYALNYLYCYILFSHFLWLIQGINTARKTIFSFSKCSEKMIFPKKSRWNMIFPVLSGKMIFPFPKNMIWFFRHKGKDDLSQKNTLKRDVFFKCSEKMVFPKNSRLWKDVISFSPKIWYFFLRRKMNICTALLRGVALLPKKTKVTLSQKNALKGDISGVAEKRWYSS